MSFWRDLRNGVHLEDSTCPENLVRPCLGPNGWIVGKSSVSSRVWKLEGAQWRILTDFAVGSWSGAIDYNGRALWQENGIGLVRELGSGYEVLGGYSSAGILDVRPDNSVMFDNGAQTPFRRSDGTEILIPKACVRAGYVAGYANNLPGGIGVVVGQMATGDLWRVWSGDPQSLPLRLDDDGLTVALSGSLGGFIPKSAWTEEPFAPPLPDKSLIRQLNSPAIFATFIHTAGVGVGVGARTFSANGQIDERDPDAGHYLRLDNGGIYHVIDTEQGGLVDDVPATEDRCIIGTIDSLMSVADSGDHAPTEYDIILVQCCATAGESLDDQQRRFTSYLHQLYKRWLAVPVDRFGVIPFVRTNFVLSETDIANNLIACSRLYAPVAVFEDLRPIADVPAFVPDWLDYWRNGQPAPIQVLPPTPIPPDPEPPVKMFANDQEKKDYCNKLAVSVAIRRNEKLGTIGSNGILDPQGQKVWQAMDQWNAVQTPGSIPPADVMLDLTLDTYGPMTGEQLQAILRYQEPLR